MVKGKRWLKGQSSSSNPSCHKHRDLAKNNRSFFSFGLSESKTESGLTQKALAQLDSSSIANLDNNFDARTIISESSGGNTFRSWATNWSDCTNATFNKVHRYWKSNSSLHKEILAVLAAVTEVIKENDGKETETEYFAALMTGLDSIQENEESAAAFLYLIALAIKKVPVAVLKAKYNDLLKSLMQPLLNYGENGNNVTLIKSSLMCLCWLLKSQEKAAWQNESTLQCFLHILSFIVHEKPKIRKCGQEAVRLILNSTCPNNSETSFVYEYASSTTADYCLKLLMNNGEEEDKNSDNENGLENEQKQKKKGKKNADQTNILYTLALLKNVIFHFKTNKLKKLAECLLRLMTLKDVIVTANCFQIFFNLFNSQLNHLSAELNAQLINAFYDFQPSANDPHQLIGWVAVIEAATKCLNRLNKELCLPHLPHLFQILMQTLNASYHKNVYVISTNCMVTVLEQCVEANIDLLVSDLKQAVDVKKSILSRIFTNLEGGLSYQYHASWVFVMKLLASAFTSFKHRDTFLIVENCLNSLANLRDSEQFDYKNEADYAIGRAVRTYGPKLVIDCVDLKITGDETSYEYPRSWMLPLLKDNIEKTELAYFIKTLLPLANKLRNKAIQFQLNKQPLEYKIFDNLQNQVWSLLPGFCNNAVDFADSFKNIAKTLGEALEKCPDLRNSLLQTIRNAILKNTDENRALMSRYAKNYLPIMFNLYTTEIRLEKDPARQSLIDTIKCYMKIADKNLSNEYLLQAVKQFENYKKLFDESIKQKINDENNNKYAASGETSKTNRVVFDFNQTIPNKKEDSKVDPYLFAKHSFLELIAVLVKYSNEKNVAFVYDLAICGIEDKQVDRTEQKKFYKIIDSILLSGKRPADDEKSSETTNMAINAFVTEKFEQIANKFVKAISSCNSAAKVPRLRCLVDLLDYVKQPSQKLFLRQLLPEVILCVKEVNQKSRDAAFKLLNSMLKLWQKLGIDSNQSEIDSLNEFMHLVMIGLAGSPNMISCTCLSLSALSFEFKEHISGSLINDLIEAACLLIKSDQKEIAMSSLNLLKVLCSIFNQTTLAQYMDKVCDAIHSLHEKRQIDNSYVPLISKSNRIRNLIKVILKKMMKKFSYEFIHEKLFVNELNAAKHKDMISDDRLTASCLSSSVKQSLENLLINIKKSIEKDKKRKAEQEKKVSKKSTDLNDVATVYTTNTAHYNEIEDLLKDSDTEDEKEIDNKSAKTNRTSKTNKTSRTETRKRESKKSAAWLQENEDEDPLDLLDPMAMKKVLATKPLTKKEIEKKKEREKKNKGFKMQNGKLIIDDEAAGKDNSDSDDHDGDDFDMKSSKSKKSAHKKKDDIEEMMDTLSLSKKSIASTKKSNLKRRMDEMDSDEEDDARSKFSYKSGGTGIHRKLDKNKKPGQVGSEYKSKKASGDIKLKNKVDPYAYLPLNFNKLNRRKKSRLEGEYKGIVKAVKKGAQKGTKQKRLNH